MTVIRGDAARSLMARHRRRHRQNRAPSDAGPVPAASGFTVLYPGRPADQGPGRWMLELPLTDPEPPAPNKLGVDRPRDLAVVAAQDASDQDGTSM